MADTPLSQADALDTVVNFKRPKVLTDSIEIWDDFASEPFLFRDYQVSLDSVLMLLPANVSIQRTIKTSQYHENALDSITTIKLGKSIIQYIRTPSVGYIEYAIVLESEIAFKKNIHIGDSYYSICKKFPDIKSDGKAYRKVYINSGEATSALIMEFKNDRLFKVTYWPYTG